MQLSLRDAAFRRGIERKALLPEVVAAAGVLDARLAAGPAKP